MTLFELTATPEMTEKELEKEAERQSEVCGWLVAPWEVKQDLKIKKKTVVRVSLGGEK